ncbi:MAG: T9SS type A sorting domain-containing protein [Candidatus Eisenbacteria bacterium]|uniref:T9SS type A sorting domain-containing protein n=1 Tax=Eiseniibacteriota bacterium TaxID=2212470 RepID=A0A956M578_UNCEI|nr:T9SS type A sorting domain-containing protein [Candidatus Eisenbacteria bacterium]
MPYRTRTKAPWRIAPASGPLLLLLIQTLTDPASAQSGGTFDLRWGTVDCGGTTFCSGGNFTLGETAGQSDAGVLSNGPFALSGGFWSGGSAETSGIDPEPEDLPRLVRLLGDAPNPFDRITTISYELSLDDTHVRIRVFDSSGREVAVLIDEVRKAGRYTAVWSGRDVRGQRVPSGVYFYRFEAGSVAQMKKIVFVR